MHGVVVQRKASHPEDEADSRRSSASKQGRELCSAGVMMRKVWIAGLLLSATLMNAQRSSAQSTVAQTNAASEGHAQDAATASAPQVAPPPPLEPAATGTPHTEMLDTTKGSTSDPLLEPKPLPRADLSLIGGIARKVDLVHNRVTVQPFGGGNRYLVYFDERTRILSGGRETTVLAIHPGDRINLDTQALGAQVFAKTIQVRTANGPAQASGQIIEVLGGQVRLQDRSSGQIVRFALTERTKVASSSGVASSPSALHTGSLVDVTFTTGRQSEAQSITIHATPGESYTFAGVLTHVDIKDGVLALDNQEDGNNYELYFDPLAQTSIARLVAGTPVQVTANFDGKRYRAMSITVTPEVPPEGTLR